MSYYTSHKFREDMLPYACLQKVMYILHTSIASMIKRETKTYFSPKVEATYANNLFLNSVPFSEITLYDPPNLEYICTK